MFYLLLIKEPKRSNLRGKGVSFGLQSWRDIVHPGGEDTAVSREDTVVGREDMAVGREDTIP